jgi:hypothetical protein
LKSTISEGVASVGAGDLVVVQDGDEWTFAVLEYVGRDGLGVAWIGDRPLPFRQNRDLVVFPGSFAASAGSLVGQRFTDPEMAGVALEAYRKPEASPC